ncbi:MAG: M20/M25/M40 family metallo-hydrolase [Chloroflexi bacterium]|nr:M20/M25/M40 family metallo-hydrolase [Chloroflexota bacterium]
MQTTPQSILTRLAKEWQHVRANLTTEKILNQAIAVQQIPAPTFAEAERADFVQEQFKRLGLHDVWRDSLGNVYGWLEPNGRHRSVIVLSAHLDTVFPMPTDLTIRQEKTRVYGPGLGDNSLGVAGLLLVAEIFLREKRTWRHSICFVANTREEGLGNLDGIRAMLDYIPPAQIAGAIVLEGIALGRVYNGGIAVRRLKIASRAEGGHSWLHFGRPSAIHGLVQLCADITQLEVPHTPRTTFNIGVIEGGQSVNSIASGAVCLLDLRSTELATLEKLEQRVRDLIVQHTQDGLTFEVNIAGNRPSGYLRGDHPLVQLAIGAQAEIGIAAGLESGSTDANILLAQGIPAVVVGITQGGNAHRQDEFIETRLLKDGLWQLVLLLAAASETL